jgi:hypothetical protein
MPLVFHQIHFSNGIAVSAYLNYFNTISITYLQF